MTEPLDNILSGREPASETNNAVEENVTQVAEAEGQQQQAPEANQGEGEAQTKMVPHEALHAEKQKVKRYTEEVSDFRKSNEALQRQVAELLQRVPIPQREQQQAPDFYEDPAAATRHTVQPEFERINQTLMANAQIIASVKYGDDKVEEAERAFLSAVQSQAVDPADYQKVINSPNRYAAAVQWFQRQQAQQEIGGDPAAYKAKLEAEIREKVLAELQQGNGQQAQQRPAVTMPSNIAGAPNVGTRSGPAWSGPAPINDIFNHARSTG